jgi:hypothetical protein
VGAVKKFEDEIFFVKMALGVAFFFLVIGLAITMVEWFAKDVIKL